MSTCSSTSTSDPNAEEGINRLTSVPFQGFQRLDGSKARKVQLRGSWRVKGRDVLEHREARRTRVLRVSMSIDAIDVTALLALEECGRRPARSSTSPPTARPCARGWIPELPRGGGAHR